MSDRVFASILIGGILHGEDALRQLAQAILEDAPDDWPDDLDGSMQEIRAVVPKGKTLRVFDAQARNGEFETIPKQCRALGLTCLTSWEASGGAVDAGVRRDEPDGSNIVFMADESGAPLVDRATVEKHYAEGTIDKLLGEMRLCEPYAMPALTFEKV